MQWLKTFNAMSLPETLNMELDAFGWALRDCDHGLIPFDDYDHCDHMEHGRRLYQHGLGVGNH